MPSWVNSAARQDVISADGRPVARRGVWRCHRGSGLPPAPRRAFAPARARRRRTALPPRRRRVRSGCRPNPRRRASVGSRTDPPSIVAARWSAPSMTTSASSDSTRDKQHLGDPGIGPQDLALLACCGLVGTRCLEQRREHPRGRRGGRAAARVRAGPRRHRPSGAGCPPQPDDLADERFGLVVPTLVDEDLAEVVLHERAERPVADLVGDRQAAAVRGRRTRPTARHRGR